MNRSGKDIQGIAIHCSAGYGDLNAMRKFWRSLGWRSDGYHLLVDINANITQVVPFNLPSNGVQGHIAKWIHICYTGGVEKSNVHKALDSRTPQQKESIKKAINLALDWISKTGGDVSKIKIKGHRDFSPDKNGDGVISAWERIKECPSFEAIPEYKDMVPQWLASHKTSEISASVEYVVRSGDSLSLISRLHGVSVDQIMRLNGMQSTLIKIGQRLKIK